MLGADEMPSNKRARLSLANAPPRKNSDTDEEVAVADLKQASGLAASKPTAEGNRSQLAGHSNTASFNGTSRLRRFVSEI